MGSKVISVSEDVYNRLKSIQLPNESFGDTIKRLCYQMTAKNLYKIAKEDSLFNSVPENVWDSLESDIKHIR